MFLDELFSKRERIISAAQKYGASEVKVFGSVIRGEEKENSDVDILVSLPKGYDMFKQRLPLAEELENIIGKHVDLVIRHELNKHIEKSILNDARDL